MNADRTELGHLDRGAMLWSAPPERVGGRALVVLMHGRSGDAEDMTVFFPALSALPHVVAVSVRGPVRWGDGWAWSDYKATGPEGVEAATRELLSWLKELPRPTSVGLVGFSQGGAMALQLLRTAPQQISCAVQLCGFLLPGLPSPDDTQVAAVRPPVLNVRGGADTAVEPAFADFATAWLRTHTNLTERTYEDLGHEISADVVTDTAAFVATHA